MDIFYFFFFIFFVCVLLLLFYCCWCLVLLALLQNGKIWVQATRARDVRVTKWNTKHIEELNKRKWECARQRKRGTGPKKNADGEKGAAEEIVKIFKCAVVNLSGKRQTRKALHI